MNRRLELRWVGWPRPQRSVPQLLQSSLLSPSPPEPSSRSTADARSVNPSHPGWFQKGISELNTRLIALPRRAMTLRGKLLFLRIGLLGCFGLSATSRAQSVTLSLASGSGTPGGSVILPLTITSAGGGQAAGIQWSLSYPSDITGVTVNFGSSATTAQKSLYCNGTQCLLAGLNTTIIPDGTVATATFQIASNPSAITIPIQITAVVATTAAGSVIPTAVGSGSVSLSLLPTLSGISCATTTINTPGNTVCTVSLTSAALLGGALVALSSNNASLSVPASVTFAAGQTSVSFTATSVGVTVDQVAAITAVYGGAGVRFLSA
jgi:Cohesin domain